MEKYSDEILQTNYEIKINAGYEYTPFAQAMPDKYKNDSVVKAYRDYYMGDKWEFATWKTNVPEWWPDNHIKNKQQEMVDSFNKRFNAKVK
jgi:hypothetical protein